MSIGKLSLHTICPQHLWSSIASIFLYFPFTFNLFTVAAAKAFVFRFQSAFFRFALCLLTHIYEHTFLLPSMTLTMALNKLVCKRAWRRVYFRQEFGWFEIVDRANCSWVFIIDLNQPFASTLNQNENNSVTNCLFDFKIFSSSKINNIIENSLSSYRLQNFPQSHQLITTLNGSVPTTQTLTTTAAFNNLNSSSASSSNYTVSEDEISKKLPKEILLRILSYLDVVSLCRCAQVSNFLKLENIKGTEVPRRQQKQHRQRTLVWLRTFIVLSGTFVLFVNDVEIAKLWFDVDSNVHSRNWYEKCGWTSLKHSPVTLLINSA